MDNRPNPTTTKQGIAIVNFCVCTETTHQYLVSDYSNLRHLCEELEIALKEMKSGHVRRILRNIK